MDEVLGEDLASTVRRLFEAEDASAAASDLGVSTPTRGGGADAPEDAALRAEDRPPPRGMWSAVLRSIADNLKRSPTAVRDRATPRKSKRGPAAATPEPAAQPAAPAEPPSFDWVAVAGKAVPPPPWELHLYALIIVQVAVAAARRAAVISAAGGKRRSSSSSTLARKHARMISWTLACTVTCSGQYRHSYSCTDSQTTHTSFSAHMA